MAKTCSPRSCKRAENTGTSKDEQNSETKSCSKRLGMTGKNSAVKSLELLKRDGTTTATELIAIGQAQTAQLLQGESVEVHWSKNETWVDNLISSNLGLFAAVCTPAKPSPQNVGASTNNNKQQSLQRCGFLAKKKDVKKGVEENTSPCCKATLR